MKKKCQSQDGNFDYIKHFIVLYNGLKIGYCQCQRSVAWERW